jgi:hypothetical protein
LKVAFFSSSARLFTVSLFVLSGCANSLKSVQSYVQLEWGKTSYAQDDKRKASDYDATVTYLNTERRLTLIRERDGWLRRLDQISEMRTKNTTGGAKGGGC